MKFQHIVDKFFEQIPIQPDYDNMHPRQLERHFREHYGENSVKKKLGNNFPLVNEFAENVAGKANYRIVAGTALTFHAWNKNRQIYTFSKKFLKDLINMGDSPVYISNLPFEGFYLDLSERFPKFPGALVFFKNYNRPFLAIALFTKDDYYYFEVFLSNSDNGKISDFKFPGDKEAERCYRAIFLILNYLSSSKPDVIQEKKESFKTKRPVLPHKDVTKWAVGTRYVREYKKAEKRDKEENKESSTKEQKVRHSPRPHVRKAHWQVYWTGPGRKVAVTKWVKPIFVNTGGTGTVIRRLE